MSARVNVEAFLRRVPLGDNVAAFECLLVLDRDPERLVGEGEGECEGECDGEGEGEGERERPPRRRKSELPLRRFACCFCEPLGDRE
jgi:hypothetical protein